MTFQVETDSIIQFIIAFAAIINVFILWKYRATPGVFYLLMLDFFVAIWAITYAFEFATPILEEKIFWSQMSYLGITFTPLSYFLFTTGFSQRNYWITRQSIAFFAIVPAITGILALTNGSHHLIWTQVTLDASANLAHYDHGVFFWIYWVYSQILIAVGLFNLISSIYRFPEFYKSQVYTLIIGSLFPIVGNLMYVTGINPFPGFDWTPALFVISGFIVTFGVSRFRMFDLVPVAKNRLPDIMNDGIIICNEDGMVEYFNQSASLLPELNEKLETGQFFNKVFPSYNNVMDKIGKREESKVEHRTNEETPKYYEISLMPLLINKKFSGQLIIFHDITLLKQTGIKLEDKNRQLLQEIELKEKLISDLDAFAHTVAHDIKSPISAIISTLSLIDDSLADKDFEMLADLLGMIRISANKSIHITDELLTLASVRKQKVNTGLLDMGKIFTEAKSRLSNLVNEKNAKIKAPETWPGVAGYALWVEEIWVNYLSNAIKYGGNPPRIIAGADAPQVGFVRFWVRDNGDGISENEQALIFNQFTRLSPEMGQGHGLGLSIVKRIVEELGGVCGVESTGIKGEGCLFYFTLPVWP